MAHLVTKRRRDYLGGPISSREVWFRLERKKGNRSALGTRRRPKHVDPKLQVYGQTGKLVVADEDERREWAKIGIRRLKRATNLTQKAVYSILAGAGVRQQTMAVFRPSLPSPVRDHPPLARRAASSTNFSGTLKCCVSTLIAIFKTRSPRKTESGGRRFPQLLAEIRISASVLNRKSG